MRTSSLGILAGILLMTAISHAQTDRESPSGFYHLDFVTREFDQGKVINSRTYSAIVSDKGGGSLRSGTKVPIPTNSGNGYTFLDVGVSIDCHDVREAQGQLTLSLVADISSAATESRSASSPPPAVHQYRWMSGVVVPLGKATQIYSSDDSASKRKLQIELTATPVK
jgi:hypothetical protein